MSRNVQVVYLIIVVAYCAGTTRGADPTPPASTRRAADTRSATDEEALGQLRSLLASGGLVLSPGVKDSPQQFDLSIELQRPGPNGPQRYSLLATRDGPRAAILVRTADGSPCFYSANNLLIIPEQDGKGTLGVYEGGMPRFDLVEQPDHSGGGCSFTHDTHAAAPSITFDAAGIIQGLLNTASSARFDPSASQIEVQAVHSRCTVVLHPPEARAGSFPLRQLGIRADRGAVIGVYHIGVGTRPAFDLLSANKAAIDGLVLPARKLTAADLASLKVLPAHPPTGVDRANAQKLMGLFPADAQTQRARRAEDLLRSLSEVAKAPAPAALRNLDSLRTHLYAGVLPSFRGGPVRQGAEPLQPWTWNYDRAKAAEALTERYGAKDAEQFFDALAAIALDKKQDPLVRFGVLDLVADTGLPPGSQLLTRLDPLATDAELAPLLASVRVRLHREKPDDISLLTKILNDEHASLPLRLRGLEALCFFDKVPEGDAAAALGEKSLNGKESILSSDRIRYVYDLGYSPSGRRVLFGALKKTPPVLSKGAAIAALRNALTKGDRQWKPFIGAAEAVALDPDSQLEAQQSAARYVIAPESSPDVAGAFIRLMAVSKRPESQALAPAVINERKAALQFVPELSALISSADPRVAEAAALSLGEGFPKGGEFAPALPALRSSLDHIAAPVRVAGLISLARLQQSDALKAGEFRKRLGMIVRDAKEGRELQFAIFNLELLSNGAFRLAGEPRVGDSLDLTPAADNWWRANAEKARQAALKWATQK